MKLRTIIGLFVLHVAAAFGQPWLLTSSNLTLNSQQYWSPTINTASGNYSQGSCFLRIGALTNALPGSIPIAGGSGTYRVWMLGKTANDSSTGGAQQTILGDKTNSVTWTGAGWHDLGVFTTSIAFTNIAMTFTNNTTPDVQDYYIAAVYVTANTNEAFVNAASYAGTVNYIADYSVPTVTNMAVTSTGNLLRNSSFELGLNGGWTWSRDTFATNRALWLVDGLSTENPHSGLFSLRLGERYARYQAISPVIVLGGTNQYYPLTLTVWARGSTNSGGATLTGNIVPVMPAVSGLPYSNSLSFSFGAPGTNWTRYTNKFYVSHSPSREFYLTFQHVSTTLDIWIDDIQLEYGTNATAWMPAGNIESGIRIRKNMEIFFPGERVSLDLVTYNAGTNQAITVNSQVYDNRNVLITNLVTSFIAPAGLSTNVIYPPTDPGHYRVMSRVVGEAAWLTDESAYNVVAFPPNTAILSNSLFGTHTTAHPAAAATNTMLGIPWTRIFSVASIRWETVQPASNTWDWSTADFAVGQLANRGRLMVCLGDMKGEPAWAFDGSRNVSTNALYTYVSNLVARYKDSIKDWETDNEPWAVSGSVEYFTTNQVATMITTEAAAMIAADPTARIWAGGGYGATGKLASVYALLDSTTRSNIFGYTVHLYPSTIDYNVSDYDQRVYDFAVLIGSWGKRVMNSESGIWDLGSRHYIPGWVSRGTFIYPWDFEDAYTKPHVYAGAHLTRMAIRSVGNGMIYMQYDNRHTGKAWARPDTQPYQLELDDRLGAKAHAYVTAANMIKEAPSFGSLTLTNVNGGTNFECFAFGPSAGFGLVTIWPRFFHTNFTLTLPVTNFGVLDGYGKLVCTNTASFTLDRLPRYIISTPLGTNGLMDAVRAASIAPLADTVAPNVSLDAEISGVIMTNSAPYSWKWTAADARQWTTDAFQDRVVTRYRINGYSDWSDWIARRRHIMESIPTNNGWFTFQLQAKDIFAGATNTAESAPFFIGGSTATNVSVGTLVVP